MKKDSPIIGVSERPKYAGVRLPALGAALFLAGVLSACAQPGPVAEKGGAGSPSPAQSPAAAATVVPPPTATPAVTAAPTAVAPRTATAGPAAVAECRSKPVRSFGKIYSENPNVARPLGCPLEPEKAGFSAEQFFQQGYMFWRSDTRQIYAITNNGRWAVFPDTFTEGEPTPVPTAPPPPGLMAPVRGFGKIWWAQKDVRESLGWAMSPERGFDGAVQVFERGAMLWSDGRFIFVLFSDGTWLRFEDTFRG